MRSVHSSPDRAVRVSALARDTVLCSWARHLTRTVPLSTQECKLVAANCWGNLTNCGGVTCNGLSSHPERVEILLAASCDRNRDKLLASRLQGFTLQAQYYIQFEDFKTTIFTTQNRLRQKANHMFSNVETRRTRTKFNLINFHPTSSNRAIKYLYMYVLDFSTNNVESSCTKMLLPVKQGLVNIPN